MVAPFRSTEAAAYLADPFYREDLLLDHIRNAVHFLQRGAGGGGCRDERGLFLELGQEILVHERIERERSDEHDQRDGENHHRLVQRPAQEGVL